MNLRILTDEELLRHAQVEFDPITGTSLEAELLRRFEARLDVGESHRPLLKALEDRDIDDPAELEKQLDKAAAVDERVNGIALLDLLLEFDIDEPATLRKALERNAKFEDVLNDLAEPLASLQALVTQE